MKVQYNERQKPDESLQKRQLEIFKTHCESFYRGSLGLYHKCSQDYRNVDIVATENIDYDEEQQKIEINPESGRIVLEALEKRLTNSTLEEIATNTNIEILVSCGLLSLKADFHEDDGARYAFSNVDLTEYIKKRDQARRSAHVSGMQHRSHLLRTEIYHCEKEKENICLRQAGVLRGRESVNKIRRDIRKFVSDYGSNVGTHPLLAGIRELIEKQLTFDTFETKNESVVCWQFYGSTISESQITKSCGTSIPSSEDKNQYTRNAVHILFSFLRIVPEGNITNISELQGIGDNHHSNLNGESKINIRSAMEVSNPYDVILTFQLSPSLSNHSMKLILNEIPASRNLIAKATGEFYVINANEESNKKKVLLILPRTNIDGKLDGTGKFHLADAFHEPVFWNFRGCMLLLFSS